MEFDETESGESRYLMSTYSRPGDMILVSGDGCELTDHRGRTYLDCMSGIAVMALGHSDPEWVATVAAEAGRLVHVSNLYHSAPQVSLARELVERSFADKVFFCNSGTEANEAAFKLARKWAVNQGSADKTRVVAFEGGFHGRTIGALSMTHKPSIREPFEPLLEGVTFAPFNDAEAAQRAIDDKTAAVFVEPLQGEGGVRPVDPAFLKRVAELCRRHRALLVFDEVQCGLGRTGTLFAHEQLGVTPDLMTLAKPLAGGLPIGALLATEEVAMAFGPGDHGSTFAGGPLVCRAAEVVLRRLTPEFLAEVRALGDQLRESLEALKHPAIVEVRGLGLLVGVELDRPVAPVVEAARRRGLLVIPAGEQVVRFAPPLIISRAALLRAVRLFDESLAAADERSE